MYAAGGRASVPPETLLKATVLMAMYSIRSERAFCERLNYDLLFKWFLDMRIDQPAFDATTFTKNRQRLLDHEVADEFFAAVVRQARLRRYMSSYYFSVHGRCSRTSPIRPSSPPGKRTPSPPCPRRTVRCAWDPESGKSTERPAEKDPGARRGRRVRTRSRSGLRNIEGPPVRGRITLDATSEAPAFSSGCTGASRSDAPRRTAPQIILKRSFQHFCTTHKRVSRTPGPRPDTGRLGQEV